MPRVNLVPREERAREFRRRIYIFPIAGAVLLVGALGGSYYYYTSEVDSAKQELQEAQNRNAQFARQLAELDRYQQIKQQKEKQLSAVTAAYNERVRWSRILDDVAMVIPDDVWLVSINAQIPGTPITAAGGQRPSGTAAGTDKDVIFEGFTYANDTHPQSMDSVATFMTRLGLLSSLTDVSLVSAETEKIGERMVIRFKIGAMVKKLNEGQKPATAPATGERPPSSTTPTTGTSTSPTTTTGSRTITSPTTSTAGAAPSGGTTP